MSPTGGKRSQMESVRLKINEHMTSVGEEILCVLDKPLGDDVCSVTHNVRMIVFVRLGKLRDFMFNLFQREMEALETLLEKQKLQNKLLDVMLQPHIRLHRAEMRQTVKRVLDDVSSNGDGETTVKRQSSTSTSTQTSVPTTSTIKQEVYTTQTSVPNNIKQEVYTTQTSVPNNIKQEVYTTQTSVPNNIKQEVYTTQTSVPNNIKQKVYTTQISVPNNIKQKVYTTQTSVPNNIKQEVYTTQTSAPNTIKLEVNQDDHTNSGISGHTDVLHLPVCKKEVSAEKEKSSRLVQEEPEPPHIKYEQEELLQRPEEVEDSDEWQPGVYQSFSNTLKSHKGLKPLKETHSMHTGKKSFSCTVCCKTFNQKGNMKKHMIIHTGKKDFSCAVCGKMFYLKGNLKSHMRLHEYETIWPFTCKVCSNAEWPLTCEVCSTSLIAQQ